MARPVGKTDVSLAFIHQFLIAREKAIQTGDTIPIEGFSGWKVGPPRHDEE